MYMGREFATEAYGDVRHAEPATETTRTEQARGNVIPLLPRQLERSRTEQARLIQQLAHHYFRDILVLACRMAGRVDGQDIAQNAFVSLAGRFARMQLTEAIALLEDPERLRGLIYLITLRRACDFWRKPA